MTPAELAHTAIVAAAAAGAAYAAVRVEIRLLWREIEKINRFIGRDQAPARKA